MIYTTHYSRRQLADLEYRSPDSYRGQLCIFEEGSRHETSHGFSVNTAKPKAVAPLTSLRVASSTPRLKSGNARSERASYVISSSMRIMNEAKFVYIFVLYIRFYELIHL